MQHNLKMVDSRKTINFFAKDLRNESEFSGYEKATERLAKRQRSDEIYRKKDEEA